ncbi:TetR/AcrR family transcriptional regulator [Dictyobacter aurantiacus]|uniref:TetR family transcriptional regulator n=1 Tax=Dictyobacter aurantiacus TaxID=1936993 RepID=A0A401ZS18_9CHLR|nr:TetR family transcriptional regulator [Dictyobacter aurantiacus]GCE09661.1 TetR family transcriptional regulator [Dictyobacter aurantiacus]
MSPDKRRGEVTRETILMAAEAVFAEHGFEGARVDAIAEASGYNKTLIFRYFGDKLGLYVAVLKHADNTANELLARAFAPFLEDDTTFLSASQLRLFLETMLQTLFDYLLEHPRFVRMMTWEMAGGWRTYAQISSQFSTADRDQFELLFRRARSSGLLRSDFIPILQLATVGQICLTYLASLPLYQVMLPGEDISSTGSLARARDYIIRFVVAGMMADSTEIEKR